MDFKIGFFKNQWISLFHSQSKRENAKKGKKVKNKNRNKK
jgi:hypothetical protein